MSDMQPEEGTILASGLKQVREEKHTTIKLQGTKEEGATVSVTNSHEGEKVSWSVSGWLKRKFQRWGTSAGIDGEIKF